MTTDTRQTTSVTELGNALIAVPPDCPVFRGPTNTTHASAHSHGSVRATRARGSPWHEVLGFVRWPILAGVAILALAIVYRYAPDRAEPRWQWISWGAVAATVLWISGSIGFTIYVSRIGSYKTYGSLGALIVLLLWFYLTAYVVLAGAELNAEIERGRTRAAPG